MNTKWAPLDTPFHERGGMHESPAVSLVSPRVAFSSFVPENPSRGYRQRVLDVTAVLLMGPRGLYGTCDINRDPQCTHTKWRSTVTQRVADVPV